MAKPYKIKRYHKYQKKGSFRAQPRARAHPLTIALLVVLLAGLVLLGAVVYEPVTGFIRGIISGEGTTPSEAETELDLIRTDEISEAGEDPQEPEKTAAVDALRTVYLPADKAADPAALSEFLKQLDGNETINAVMVDIKNSAGNVLFNSKNEQAAEWGALPETPYDLAALARTLAGRNLRLVVRMSVFRDPIAAGIGRDNAIRYQDTDYLWLDNAQSAGGQPWLNPYSTVTRDYIYSLALEAAQAGASMIVLENAHFPNYSQDNATFGETGGQDRQQILETFIGDLTAQLAEQDCRTAVYLTALSLTQETDNQTRYGGSPLQSAGSTIVLGALPYQFGGDFAVEGMEIVDPIQNPGAAVEAMLAYLLDGTASPGELTVIPLLQGGNDPNVQTTANYSKVQVDAQISAVEAREIAEYILYTTEGSYTLQ